MSTRWWLNIGLLVVIGILALLVIFRPGGDKSAPAAALTAVAPETVQTISIDRPDQLAVVLEKSGDRWRVTAPIKARANTFRIDNILRILTARSEWRMPADENALAQFGLDKPLLEVRFDSEPILFGGLHPLSQQQYVRVRDEIHLIGAHYFQPLAGRANDFLDSRLFAPGIEPLKFRTPQFSLELVDGIWRLEPAVKELASDKLTQFVQEWRNARALTVESYHGEPYQEHVVIHVRADAQNSQESLEIGILKRQLELILVRKDEGLQYHFPEDAGARLLDIAPR